MHRQGRRHLQDLYSGPSMQQHQQQAKRQQHRLLQVECPGVQQPHLQVWLSRAH